MNTNLNSIKYRPEIDGLRAIAVCLVVLFHAVPNFVPGGFVGVDVFFVISGFLITSIIHTELMKNSFSIIRFYEKRILRIFPALILILLSCLVLGYFTLLSREYKSLGKHVAAGASYISNFILMKESGYFDVQATNKPLLHLWSLAIEEQFYLVWPLVLMTTTAKKRKPIIVVFLGILISLCLCIGYTNRLPEVVFYTPLTRCWELLIGASLSFSRNNSQLAISNFRSIRVGRVIFNSSLAWELISILGIAAIACSAMYFDSKDRFPYWRALIPCMGAALIIGSSPNAIVSRILSSRFFVQIGLISYPLYLWHWPALFFARILTNNRDTYLPTSVAVIFSFIAAMATHRLVESNVRRTSAIARTSCLLFLTLITIGCIGYAVVQDEGFPNRYPSLEQQARNIDSFTWNEEGYNNNEACIKLLNEKFTQYCNLMDPQSPATTALIGDSTANHFYHGLSTALRSQSSSENLLQIGRGGCPPLIGIEAVRENGKQNCNQITGDLIAYISENTNIRTVILTMTGATYINDTVNAVKNQKTYYRLHSLDDSTVDDPILILEKGLRQTLTKLISMHRRVILLNSAPVLPYDPSECLSTRPFVLMLPKRDSCAIDQEIISVPNAPYRALISRISSEYPSVEIWDPYNFICRQDKCHPIDKNIPLYRDSLHLSIYGSEFIGRKLIQKYHLEVQN